MSQIANDVPSRHRTECSFHLRTGTALLAVICLVAVPADASAVEGKSSKQVTIREMIGKPAYWPPECSPKTCVLTGNGGILDVWINHVDVNAGKVFVVRGKCASACEWAYRHARDKGEKTIVLPGAYFVRHDPVPARWR